MRSRAGDPFRPSGWVGDVRGDPDVYRTVQREPGWWPVRYRDAGPKGAWTDSDGGWPVQCNPSAFLEKRNRNYGGPQDRAGLGDGRGSAGLPDQKSRGWWRVVRKLPPTGVPVTGPGGRSHGRPTTPGPGMPPGWGLPGVTGPHPGPPKPPTPGRGGTPSVPGVPGWRWRWEPTDPQGGWSPGRVPPPGWGGSRTRFGDWRHWRSLGRVLNVLGVPVGTVGIFTGSGAVGPNQDSTG